MDKWTEMYEKKLCDPDTAVRVVKNGDRVVLGAVAARPEELVRALMRNADRFRDVRIMHGLSNGGEDYCLPEYKENFIHESLFASKNTRKYIEAGYVRFYPNHFCEIPHFFRSGIWPVDVLMVQLSPPDRFGYCSTGTNADFIRAAAEKAEIIIAQINRNVPWCGSEDCLIRLDEIDHIIEYDDPLPVIPVTEPNEIEKKIGAYCASLINDGDTIQVGIGRIPDAVCAALKDKKNLGVHSEMISDGLMELWKEGVITNSEKSFDKGFMVATFLYGSQELYDFADHNPAVVLKDVSRINDPVIVSQCSNLVSLNTCLEVDLMGQVVSGTSGFRQISGAGGQLDFMRGVSFSEDGKGRAILAMTSAYVKNGVMKSRITPFIKEGSAVTATRQDADYFVTEYGIARVMGKNLKDRARALIEIAHPDCRQELIDAYERRFKQEY